LRARSEWIRPDGAAFTNQQDVSGYTSIDLVALGFGGFQGAGISATVGRETWTTTQKVEFDPGNSPRLAVHLGILTQPTCRTQIEIFLVARTTMDHVLPLYIRLDVLVLGRPSR
jgi:hypothetical protein